VKHWQSIIKNIENSTGKAFSVNQQQGLAGGSINNAVKLTGEDGSQYFVKTNRTGFKAMFEAEASGLKAMADSNSIRVPSPVCFGDDGLQSYIVMEYLELSGRPDQVKLGQQVASMHRVTSEQFGWHIDNTIGATTQPNTAMDDWLEFWRDQRLGFQLKLAEENGYGGDLQELGEKLMLEMSVLFKGRSISASMLHGDLWGGNVGGLADGTPVIFDPALYYGDREADIAMTYLFGGFMPDFYSSYQESFPLDDGFVSRVTFYNLYHIINHLNLFGGGYHGQAVDMLRQVLAEIR
jgi:fructosamine-3-kinase